MFFCANMRSFTTFTVALAATLAIASPLAPKAFVEKPFSVQVKSHTPHSPADALARVYRKYDWNVDELASNAPNSVQREDVVPEPIVDLSIWTIITLPALSGSTTSEPSQTTATTTPVKTTLSVISPTRSAAGNGSRSGSHRGEVHARPTHDDAEYISPVTIGGQLLQLDFDTGSSDLWVFSTEMQASQRGGHTLFNASKSPTFSPYPGATFSIEYGDGSTASGSVGFDEVTIGGVSVQHQAVELAEAVSPSFLQNNPSDGLLGLGFINGNQIRPQQQNTFLTNVLPSLPQPVFTANLATNASGTYTFGTIDSSQYLGSEIHYVPVDPSRGYWEFASGAFSVNGKTSPCSTCSPAIADTGTSMMVVDSSIAKAFYAQVHGAELTPGGWAYPCNSTLPDLGVAMGDYMVTLKGSELTYTQLEGATGMVCLGGVQPNAASSGRGMMQIYGDVFLKQVFAVFDAAAPRFGVAPKA